MKLQELTSRIFYYPQQPEYDRPMLAYIMGSKFSLAVDAGYSPKHVADFYAALQENGLKKPDFTVITHWHYDHTFGMNYLNGASIAHRQTNRQLKKLQQMAAQPGYIDKLKNEDFYFSKEYENQPEPHIVLSDIEFQDRLVLDLGDLSAVIFHTEAPHSDDTVCVYIPEEKALFLGDSTSEDFFNNSYLDKNKLQKLVNIIENTNCLYCILSHCEPLKKAELLAYLHTI